MSAPQGFLDTDVYPDLIAKGNAVLDDVKRIYTDPLLDLLFPA